MKKFASEFKAFIMRGNVMDMAVGVIIATAFGKITSSLVNEVFMPMLGWVLGTRDMTALNVVVREAVMDGETVVQEAITLGFGTFVGAVIDFILVAFVVFMIVKAFNKAHDLAEARKKNEEEPEEEAEEEEPKPTTEELLGQILEELKKSKSE
ncbi:MAG: large conductance mechanosensitive channel protein MscL [Ruminococcaceae bacterium]|nr:large conductance mechanosensitive channel protein MscL [Oscillospiraceae bacterium]